MMKASDPIRWLYAEHAVTPYPGNVGDMFAVEELWCHQAGDDHPPILHLWRHADAFVVGLRDRRLPHAKTAMQQMEARGVSVWVRNSGGAAVPLHSGVLNATMIVPKPPGKADLHEDFRRMSGWIAELCAAFGLSAVAGEIEGGYCPGDYDLSVQGRKFCGIAQRRTIQAVAIQAFINVEGAGAPHAALARTFYDTASGGDAAASGVPDVRPERTCFLSELQPGLTMERFLAQITDRLGAQRQLASNPDRADVVRLTEQFRMRYDR